MFRTNLVTIVEEFSRMYDDVIPVNMYLFVVHVNVMKYSYITLKYWKSNKFTV